MSGEVSEPEPLEMLHCGLPHFSDTASEAARLSAIFPACLIHPLILRVAWVAPSVPA